MIIRLQYSTIRVRSHVGYRSLTISLPSNVRLFFFPSLSLLFPSSSLVAADSVSDTCIGSHTSFCARPPFFVPSFSSPFVVNSISFSHFAQRYYDSNLYFKVGYVIIFVNRRSRRRRFGNAADRTHSHFLLFALSFLPLT